MVRDVDGVFGRYCTCTYMKKHRFKDITRDAERVMKSKNTQSSLRSPMRLPRNATQEQFDLLQALAHTGSEGERYVERSGGGWDRIHPGVIPIYSVCMYCT